MYLLILVGFLLLTWLALAFWLLVTPLSERECKRLSHPFGKREDREKSHDDYSL